MNLYMQENGVSDQTGKRSSPEDMVKNRFGMEVIIWDARWNRAAMVRHVDEQGWKGIKRVNGKKELCKNYTEKMV